MEFLQILLLALVQGLTEFLPISSSAHLILPSQLLGWADQGMAFDVAVHVGTLVAVVWYFRRDLWHLARGSLAACHARQSNEASRLSLALLVGSLPAIVVGFCADDWIEGHLRSGFVIAMATIIFGLLLGLADRRSVGQRDLAQITLMTAFLVGLAQALALIPGTSRSGVTMTAALFLGLSRTASAQFSFLLSIPIIAGAGLLQTLKVLENPGALSWSVFGWGALLSGISAYVCIRLFLAWIETIGMWPFVVYRLVLGIGLLFVV